MSAPAVVRFAPSPTGYLHIGGARTAVFNWLWARKTGGKFILRIEDTDAERSTAASVDGILESLTWLGLNWDEGPHFQSRFIEDHLAAADRLFAAGRAYRCYCTSADLEKRRNAARSSGDSWQYDGTCRRLSSDEAAAREAAGQPYTLRLKVPRNAGAVVFEDAVYGRIEKKYADIEDFVILRSNGRPLYVLSNAVDDIRDGITHVIRGQDGLANTPKQILIYEALGAPIPQFAHMSLALDAAKAKISKRRHGERVSVDFYRRSGFLPWALVNFLALLGWSTRDARQIFSPQELIEAFSLEGISRANCVFDVRQEDPKFITDPKAISINAHYLRSIPVSELAPLAAEELKRTGLWDPDYDGDRRQWFLDTIDLLRSRFHLTTDFSEAGRAFFSDEFSVDPASLQKYIRDCPKLERWFPLLADRLSRLEPFDAANLESALRTAAKDLKVKPGLLVNGIRVAATGRSKGPEFLEVLVCIGRERLVRRLKRAAGWFDTQEGMSSTPRRSPAYG